MKMINSLIVPVIPLKTKLHASFLTTRFYRKDSLIKTEEGVQREKKIDGEEEGKICKIIQEEEGNRELQ